MSNGFYNSNLQSNFVLPVDNQRDIYDSLQQYSCGYVIRYAAGHMRDLTHERLMVARGPIAGPPNPVFVYHGMIPMLLPVIGRTNRTVSLEMPRARVLFDFTDAVDGEFDLADIDRMISDEEKRRKKEISELRRAADALIEELEIERKIDRTRNITRFADLKLRLGKDAVDSIDDAIV